MKKVFVIVFLFMTAIFLSARQQQQQESLPIIKYATAEKKWRLDSGLGNHRLIVDVKKPSEYVLLQGEHRRRDLRPELLGVRVFCLEDNMEVQNVKIVEMDRENCKILFQAKTAGQYAIYTMPLTIGGKQWYFPVVNYFRREDMKADVQWLNDYTGVHTAVGIETVEARTERDSFYPMEVPMTQTESQDFVKKHSKAGVLLVTENRIRPIKMFREFPQIWVDRADLQVISDTVARNEYYCFQAVLYAEHDTKVISASAAIGGKKLSDDVFTCFNLGGIDCLGKPFTTDVFVSTGEVLPLWCGLDVEKISGGTVDFEVKTDAGLLTGKVHLTVSSETLPNKGDNDLWRLSRLRWFNSTIGLEEYIPAGFEAVQLKDRTISILGRKFEVGKDGLPSRIASNFSFDNSTVVQKDIDILTAPVRLNVTKNNKPLVATNTTSSIKRKNSERVDISSSMRMGDIKTEIKSYVEFDGYVDVLITLTPQNKTVLDDVNVTIPLSKSCAKYFMGLGCEGGLRPTFWHYDFNPKRNYRNNQLWVGRENAGLYIMFKNTEDPGKEWGTEVWYNNGNGCISLSEDGETVLIKASTGKLTLNEPTCLKFSLMATPLKKIKYQQHWHDRYYHIDGWNNARPDIEKAKRATATIINVHQGGGLNPYINYPFPLADEMKAEADRAHKNGIKYKIYYTVRELSTIAAELPLLRALKGEILSQGKGFELAAHFTNERNDENGDGRADPWMLEHLVEGFSSAWQQRLHDGDYDGAVATSGISRLNNYYLEGLSWLIREVGIDGLYLDGIAYGREIMKRVRKTMDTAKQGCLIDFHSGNDYLDYFWRTQSHRRCAVTYYMELLPYMDRLWLGEGYDYENYSQDWFMTEVAGIPFGLMGEMLSHGGNQYRGMVFGMTCRYGWQTGGNPEYLWKFWDEFGFDESQMYGYWNPDCPGSTNNSAVPMTIYVNNKAVCLVIANWRGKTGINESAGTIITLDCKRLGIKDDYVMTAPAIEGFQQHAEYCAGESISIENNKGIILTINKDR